MRFHARLPNDTTMLLMLVVFMIAIISTSISLGDKASDNAMTISVIGAVLILARVRRLARELPPGGRRPGARDRGGACSAAELRTGLGVLALAGRRCRLHLGVVRRRHRPRSRGARHLEGVHRARHRGNRGERVENVVGIQLAWKRRYDLAISVVKNSVAQIAAFLYPALVLISLLFTQRLTFGVPSSGLVLVVALVFAALAIWQITGDGRAAGYEGFALVATYAVLATVVWFE